MPGNIANAALSTVPPNSFVPRIRPHARVPSHHNEYRNGESDEAAVEMVFRQSGGCHAP
jgi:hypothetical protein